MKEVELVAAHRVTTRTLPFTLMEKSGIRERERERLCCAEKVSLTLIREKGRERERERGYQEDMGGERKKRT